MKQIAGVICCVILLGAAGNYNAALGVGDKTCGTWSSMRRGPQAEAAAQWFLGYLSGMNVGTAPMAIMNEEGRGMLPPLDQYCATHPATNVMAAATALIQVEYKNRIETIKRSGEPMAKKP